MNTEKKGTSTANIRSISPYGEQAVPVPLFSPVKDTFAPPVNRSNRHILVQNAPSFLHMCKNEPIILATVQKIISEIHGRGPTNLPEKIPRNRV